MPSAPDRMAAIATLIGTVLLCGEICAEPLAVLGPGNMPCRGWLYGREQAKPAPEVFELTAAGEMWVLGYVTAANVYELRLTPADIPSGDKLFLWIDNYCRRHLDDRLAVAAHELIISTRSMH